MQILMSMKLQFSQVKQIYDLFLKFKFLIESNYKDYLSGNKSQATCKSNIYFVINGERWAYYIYNSYFKNSKTEALQKELNLGMRQT